MDKTFDFISQITDAIAKAKSMLQDNTGKTGYVVVSARHIHVGNKYGLGNTAFTIKSTFGLDKVSVWDTEESAKANIDSYLKDMYGNVIPQHVQDFESYIKEMISYGETSLSLANELIESTTPVSK